MDIQKISLSIIGGLLAVGFLVILVNLGGAGLSGRDDDGGINPGVYACTEEAMLCPDGSYVGRSGPNCAFAPCPNIAPAPTPMPPVSEGGGEGGVIDLPAPRPIGGGGSIGGSPGTVSGSACVAQGGTWDAQFSECLGVGASECSAIGGAFNECASACRNDPEAEMCTMQCVQICIVK